jgi:hypothetical protein
VRRFGSSRVTARSPSRLALRGADFAVMAAVAAVSFFPESSQEQQTKNSKPRTASQEQQAKKGGRRQARSQR